MGKKTKVVKKKEIKKPVKVKSKKLVVKGKKKHPGKAKASDGKIDLLSPKKIPKKITRIPTGIKVFDGITEGGFKEKSTNLIVGDVGTGKTIFAMQFLVNSMKKGERCLYVSFEETREQFYLNMLRFGWNLEEYEKKGLFVFLEDTPVRIRSMVEEGGGSVESVIIKNKISRIVIDSLTSFALLFETDLNRREASLGLFDMISKWNCTCLLTLEGHPTKDGEDNVATKVLEYESDSLIFLYYLMDRGERNRYMEILKMRGTKHSKKIYPFSIGKSGIELSTRPASNPMK